LIQSCLYALNLFHEMKNRKGKFMIVTIDRSGCISCGICEAICPKVFRSDDSGLAEVYHQPDPDSETQVAQAAADCPVAVITTEG